MKPFFVFAIAAFLFACNNNQQPHKNANNSIAISDSAYKWTKIFDSAAWKKNYNYQMFVIKDTLWVFHPDGNWFSADGSHWIKSSLPNAINNLAFLDYIVFNNAVYGLGYFKGNIETHQYSSKIFHSNDLKSWKIAAETSNLPKRFFYHPFVFNNKIWIIGGEDNHVQYADIWNSADGINWMKQKDSLPFGKRSNSLIINFKGKLFLLNNDVWSSTNGLDWQQETPAIFKDEQVFGYAAVVFDDKIWLLGCNRNEQFTSQVFCSSDGKNWEAHSAPWLPRGGCVAAVFNNKIYMTGGKYGGTPAHTEFRYDNDLWTMEKIK